MGIHYKKSEDTKGVIRSSKSKNSEKYNGQTKRGNMTFNDLQNTSQKNKDWTTRTALKTGSEPRCSGRGGKSTSNTGSEPRCSGRIGKSTSNTGSEPRCSGRGGKSTSNTLIWTEPFYCIYSSYILLRIIIQLSLLLWYSKGTLKMGNIRVVWTAE